MHTMMMICLALMKLESKHPILWRVQTIASTRGHFVMEAYTGLRWPIMTVSQFAVNKNCFFIVGSVLDELQVLRTHVSGLHSIHNLLMKPTNLEATAVD